MDSLQNILLKDILRDAKSYQIVEGTSNVQKMIIAQFALGYRKA